MKEHELKEALHAAAADCQLSEYRKRQILLQMKGEEPVKKKITFSVVLVMVIVLLTLSAAVALVHSTIVDQLFGSSENAPEEVSKRIQRPQESTVSDLGTLSLDEWFYDGQALHTAFSIMNTGSDPLFYTLDGIELNGNPVSYSRMKTEGAGDSGFLLGGSVNGKDMPVSVSLYNQGNELYLFDENGKYAGTTVLPEGNSTLKIRVAVWKPINQVELIDYQQYEGINTTKAIDHLTVDANGYSQLWLFRSEKDTLNYNASQSGALVYRDTYQKLGWMELLGTIEVEENLSLSKEQAVRLLPERMDYVQEEYRLVLEQFDFSHTGGRLSARIYGNADLVKQLMNPHGLSLVDPENERILSNGTWWEGQPDDVNGMQISMNLIPITGDLPETVYIVPAVNYSECWDQNAPHFRPDLPKPENVIDGWEYDFNRAIVIQLRTAP